ncbi:hypothetical protein DFJ74DRAFT_712141 [Hyaloraphidium curvatum]|nr:hypothetical protein DFJ74DRAFT_712141 [Hyaloraphidium curvatum]
MDLERTLMMNASIAAATGILFTFTWSRWWILFSITVLGFLLQHAIQGYCPHMVWFRALGFRTEGEIEDEAAALRIVRGRVGPGLEIPEGRRAQRAEKEAAAKSA